MRVKDESMKKVRAQGVNEIEVCREGEEILIESQNRPAGDRTWFACSFRTDCCLTGRQALGC